MDGELLRCIAMMRDSNPQISCQGAQIMNELVSNNKPEAIKAFLAIAGSNEDQMVRSYAAVNLIRAIRDCQHDLNEPQKIEVIQQLTGLLRPGLVSLGDQQSICELIMVLSFRTNQPQTEFSGLAVSLCDNQETLPAGAFLFSMLMTDMTEEDMIPVEHVQRACSLVPGLLQNGNSEVKSMGYLIVQSVLSCEDVVAKCLPLDQFYGQVAELMWKEFNGFYGENQSGSESAAFLRLMDYALELQAEEFLKYFAEMPQQIAERLGRDVEQMVLVASIGILEAFCRNMPEVILESVDGFLTALIAFAKKEYEACPTDSVYTEPSSCFVRIAEGFIEIEEEEAGMSTFARYIGALHNGRDESSLVVALMVIDAIFEPFGEQMTLAFDAVVAVIDAALNPTSPLANPRTVEAAARVVTTIVRSTSLAEKLLVKFEPYLLQYLESDACLIALTDLYDQAGDLRADIDVNVGLGPLFAELQKAMSSGNVIHMDQVLAAISSLLLLANDDLSETVFQIIPMLGEVIRAKSAQVPSAIFCFGALARSCPERVRGILNDVVKAIIEAMDAGGNTCLNALLQLINFVDIYEQTIKEAAYPVFCKAREVYTKVVQPNFDDFGEENEYTSEAQTYNSLKQNCLTLMGLILSTYTDVGNADDLKAFNDMVEQFSGECACSKEPATEPMGQLILTLLKRGQGDLAKAKYETLIDWVNEVQTVDELRAVWAEISRLVWHTGFDLLSVAAKHYFEILSTALQGSKSIYMSGKKRKLFDDRIVGRLMDATMAFFFVLGDQAGEETAKMVMTWLEKMYASVKNHVSRAAILNAMSLIISKFPSLIQSTLPMVVKRLVDELQVDIGDCKQAALDGLDFLIEAAPEAVLGNIGQPLMAMVKGILNGENDNEAVKECALATFCAITANSDQVNEETSRYVLGFLPVSAAGFCLKFITRFVLTAWQKYPEQMAESALRLSVQVFSAPVFLINSIPEDQKAAMRGILASAPEAQIRESANGIEFTVMEIQRNLARIGA